MKHSILIALLVLTTAPCSVFGACNSEESSENKCRIVHGRLSIYNGAWGAVIWPIGTKHLLAVRSRNEALMMPKEIESKLFTNGSENDVYGDYEVCPFSEERKNEIQVVCVESAKNLVVRKR